MKINDLSVRCSACDFAGAARRLPHPTQVHITSRHRPNLTAGLIGTASHRPTSYTQDATICWIVDGVDVVRVVDVHVGMRRVV